MTVMLKKIGNDANNRIFVKFDTTLLEKIEKELGKKFMAQVGILGQKTDRLAQEKGETFSKYKKRVKAYLKNREGATANLSNADIGLIHEKGSKSRGIERRSFLEEPLMKKMPKLMQRVGAKLLEGLSAANIRQAYAALGAIGEGVVMAAFHDHGPGWKENSLETQRRKHSSSPLIATGQLRDSIANRVVTR